MPFQNIPHPFPGRHDINEKNDRNASEGEVGRAGPDHSHSSGPQRPWSMVARGKVGEMDLQMENPGKA